MALGMSGDGMSVLSASWSVHHFDPEIFQELFHGLPLNYVRTFMILRR